MVQIVCLPVPTIFLLHTMVVPVILLPKSTVVPAICPPYTNSCDRYGIWLLYTNGYDSYGICLPYTNGLATYLSTLHQWLCHLSVYSTPMVVQAICKPHTMVMPVFYLPYTNGGSICLSSLHQRFCHCSYLSSLHQWFCHCSYLSALHQWLCQLSVRPTPMVVPAICPPYTNGCASYLSALHQ